MTECTKNIIPATNWYAILDYEKMECDLRVKHFLRYNQVPVVAFLIRHWDNDTEGGQTRNETIPLFVHTNSYYIGTSILLDKASKIVEIYYGKNNYDKYDKRYKGQAIGNGQAIKMLRPDVKEIANNLGKK